MAQITITTVEEVTVFIYTAFSRTAYPPNGGYCWMSAPVAFQTNVNRCT